MPASKKDINKKIKREKLKITYKGVFDLKKLYEFLHSWLVEEGFKADDLPCGGDMYETYYWERRSAQGFNDYIIWWRAKKKPDNYSTDWVEYKLSLDFLGIAIAKTDIMHEGKKIGAHKGEINIEIKPTVILDPKKMWNTDSFLAKFAKTFAERTYKKEIKYHKDELDDLAFRLQEAIKDFFGLSTFGDYGERFHPQKGFGWA